MTTIAILLGVLSLATLILLSKIGNDDGTTEGTSAILWEKVCTEQTGTHDLPFCNMNLSRQERVADYIGRIDMPTKAKMMVNDASEFEALHIPPYQWWSEGLHGPLVPCVCVASNPEGQQELQEQQQICKCPSSYPCPSALAVSFNNTLYNLIGAAIGKEGRAINNVRKRDSKVGDGIDFWSPTINMQRDPRWGRNQEVPGEDPVLTGQYAVNYVRGLQEGAQNDFNDAQDVKNSNPYVQIVAGCKHFVANSLEDWNGHTRMNFDANISKTDLSNYYMPAFRACVMEGKSLGVMCSYNSINGKPACANEWLLNTALRETWGFQGYVTSDCGAISFIVNPHKYAANGSEASALAIKAGTDVNCGSTYLNSITSAIQEGLLTEEELDKSFSRLVDIQMRLGLFDNSKASHPYFQYGINDIDTAEYQSLALEAAHQSIVLLKNDGGTALPLKKGRKVAVIGPHFNATDLFLSNYHGGRCISGNFDCVVTPLSAIKNANVNGSTVGSKGCEVSSADASYIARAVAIAEEADDVILMVGIDGSQESEGRDRYNTTLPGLQSELVTQIAAIKNSTTTLVIVSGGSMSLGPIRDMVSAIVWAGYGGERAAEALADVLYGSYNPSGKLAATWYPADYVNQIPLTEMGLSVSPGRTHMFYTGEPEFSFGHGLSYTSWSLKWSKKSKKSQESESEAMLQQQRNLQWSTTEYVSGIVGKILHFDIEVTNTGTRAGKQTILLFVVPKTKFDDKVYQVPLKQKLLSYQNVDAVNPGEHRRLRFRVDTLELAVANQNGDKTVLPGEYIFSFRDGENHLQQSILIQGPPIVVELFPIDPSNDNGHNTDNNRTAVVTKSIV
eukprot:CAMPEP_0195294214 /NCGR_PEP_ID=MMETSP0707-20130614/14353_1 /TAXON_ID=33640 /ORGANISM="Asterionellopsis glacialis, Strain CCMP134" /LENGTH=844 /DNA_ID=CAMNT_0040355121 /DNA_START=52 /DNA_END=2586 /DNA_ORIENTATION=+